eukprot:925322-Amphidinium_carterae.1
MSRKCGERGECCDTCMHQNAILVFIQPRQHPRKSLIPQTEWKQVLEVQLAPKAIYVFGY